MRGVLTFVSARVSSVLATAVSSYPCLTLHTSHVGPGALFLPNSAESVSAPLQSLHELHFARSASTLQYLLLFLARHGHFSNPPFSHTHTVTHALLAISYPLKDIWAGVQQLAISPIFTYTHIRMQHEQYSVCVKDYYQKEVVQKCSGASVCDLCGQQRCMCAETALLKLLALKGQEF